MIVLPSQRNAQVIRDRLMNGKPPSFRSKIVEIRRRMEELANRPVHEFRPLRISAMEEIVVNADELARMPSWRRIALEVCAKHGLKLQVLISTRRDVPVVLARHEAMWRLHHETTMSSTQIGRCFKRDHSTSIHAVRKHQWRLDQEAAK